jgi:hypothetical protein
VALKQRVNRFSINAGYVTNKGLRETAIQLALQMDHQLEPELSFEDGAWTKSDLTLISGSHSILID